MKFHTPRRGGGGMSSAMNNPPPSIAPRLRAKRGKKANCGGGAMIRGPIKNEKKRPKKSRQKKLLTLGANGGPLRGGDFKGQKGPGIWKDPPQGPKQWPWRPTSQA